MKKSIPYRTAAVRNHDLVHDSDIHKEWAMNLILAALVDPSFAGSAGNKPRLTNDDIAVLAADRVSDNIIVRIIEFYEGEYEVSAQSLLHLCRDWRGRKGNRGNAVKGAQLDGLGTKGHLELHLL